MHFCQWSFLHTSCTSSHKSSRRNEYNIHVHVFLFFQRPPLSSRHKQSIKQRLSSLLWNFNMQPRKHITLFQLLEVSSYMLAMDNYTYRFAGFLRDSGLSRLVLIQWSKGNAFEDFLTNFDIPRCRLCRDSNNNKELRPILRGIISYFSKNGYQKNRDMVFRICFRALVLFDNHLDLSLHSVAQTHYLAPSFVLVSLLYVLPLESHNSEEVEDHSTEDRYRMHLLETAASCRTVDMPFASGILQQYKTRAGKYLYIFDDRSSKLNQ